MIFGLGLLNITLAMVVFVYRHTLLREEPLLHLWQHAKLVAGVGYLLGWVRPLLPEEWRLWAQVGNIMQVAGIAIELAVYARYLGATHWVPKIKQVMAWVLPVFVLVIVVPESRHPMIVYGTGVAGLLYLAMTVLHVQRARQSPELLKLMAAINGLLTAVLLTKTWLGLWFQEFAPYQENLINALVYAVGIWVMCANGFGFLMLVQQQADRTLRRIVRQLAESEASERELLRTAAHEFRTPAAMVKASVDSLALIDKDLPPEVLRRHRNIRLAVDRMTDLASKLITRDRFKDSVTNPQKEPIGLNMIVSNATRHYPPEVPLRFQMKAPMAQVEGDPVLLRLALMNLIDNALIHSPAGAPVEIGTSVGLDWCRIDVKDHGTGVPDEHLADLFTGRFSGSGNLAKGVGLGIVKAVVESHGGQVSVAKNTPVGSTFSITLPLQSRRSAIQA